MKTSLIIPFKNEVAYAKITMEQVYLYLSERKIDFELVAVDDSTDETWDILKSFEKTHKNVVVVKGENPSGYGKALRKGFSVATGDIVIPFNGDFCDSLDDVISYIKLIEEGNDMVFGSRFMSGAKVNDSSVTKDFLSQLGNIFLQLLFQTSCSDITNSFKAYRKTVLDEIKPTADDYNIVLEIPLKGIAKKYKYTTIPVNWSGREYGRSKMSIIKSMITYLFTAFKIRFQTLVT